MTKHKDSRSPAVMKKGFVGRLVRRSLACGIPALALAACGADPGSTEANESTDVAKSTAEISSACVGQTTLPASYQYVPCPGLQPAQCTSANGCSLQTYTGTACGGGNCYQYSYQICSGSGGAYTSVPPTTVNCNIFSSGDCAQHPGCSLGTSTGYCGRSPTMNCERAVGQTCCGLDHTLYLCTENGWSSRAPC